MRRAVDKHAPSFPRLRVELVDLERDPVFRMGYSGPEVLVRSTVLRGPEQDGAVVQLVVHGQHGQIPLSREDETTDSARRDQPQALGLIEGLQYGVGHYARSSLAFWITKPVTDGYNAVQLADCA